MVPLHHDDRRLGFWPLPMRGEIEVSTREIVKHDSGAGCQMSFCFMFPQVEAFVCRNPTEGKTEIGNDELRRACPEEVSYVTHSREGSNGGRKILYAGETLAQVQGERMDFTVG